MQNDEKWEERLQKIRSFQGKPFKFSLFGQQKSDKYTQKNGNHINA